MKDLKVYCFKEQNVLVSLCVDEFGLHNFVTDLENNILEEYDGHDVVFNDHLYEFDSPISQSENVADAFSAAEENFTTTVEFFKKKFAV